MGKEKFFGTYLGLAATMWNHFPKMREVMRKRGYHLQGISESEMADLFSYLCFIRALCEPGDVRKGKKLLRSKGCIRCHKFGGVGGDIGPDITASKDYLSPLRLLEAMWNHGPAIQKALEKQGIERPRFEGREIVDLAAAVRSYMSPERVPIGSLTLGEPSNGKKLLREKQCLRCHSDQGEGGNVAPDFAKMDLSISVTELAGAMWNHGPQMWRLMKEKNIPYPVFETGEMADVVAYVYSLRFQDAPGDSNRGRQLLSERKCLTCHKLSGHGGTLAPDLANITGISSPMALVAAMWNHAPAMQDKLQNLKLQWPKLTARDMADLYAFFHSGFLVAKSTEP